MCTELKESREKNEIGISVKRTLWKQENSESIVLKKKKKISVASSPKNFTTKQIH